MLKYPYELSSDRLSLLNKEQRRQYEYEHSTFCSPYLLAISRLKFQYMQLINEDYEYNCMTPAEKDEMAEELANIQINAYIDDIAAQLLPDVLSASDKTALVSYVKENINNPENVLNEADYLAGGHDMTYWTGDLGWLGKLAGGILTLMTGTIVGLIIAGQDKAAMKQLYQYMNQIVEKVDKGLYKRKNTGFFGKIKSFFGSKNETYDSDLSIASFTSIRNNFSRNIVAKAMCFLKGLGCLDTKLETAIQQLRANELKGKGMDELINNIAKPISKFGNV